MEELTDTNEKIAQYQLSEQIGHVLRKASQRHSNIFTEAMPEGVTPTRFAAMVVLLQKYSLSQNELGRHTAMDAATIKGVVDRLKARNLVSVDPDPNDARRNRIKLTTEGQKLIKNTILVGYEVSEQTLAPLTATEQQKLLELLSKII